MDRRKTSARVRALQDLALLRSLPTPELVRTARLAAHIAQYEGGEPMAAVHVLDDAHQHRLAASGGVPLMRTPVDDSMCVQVVDEGRAVYTSDASSEVRFAGNPFTSGHDPVRLYYSTPVHTSDGTVIGTLCVFDVQAAELTTTQRDRLDDLAHQTGSHLELTGLSRHLKHLATHDALTGIANRLLLSERIHAALRDDRREPHEPALLLVDLDDFKRVNDGHGHQVGDEVLCSTAARLTEAVRHDDLVARIGGDEFAVLLDRLQQPELLGELVERITAAMAVPHATARGEVLCTVSVGRALGQSDDLAYELLARADEDMYRNKHEDARPGGGEAPVGGNP